MTQAITLYLALINLLSFILFGIDKWKAKRARWRIPESTLLTIAALGGSLGAWLGMRVWHHKTLHKKFAWGIPTLCFCHMALAVYIIVSLYATLA